MKKLVKLKSVSRCEPSTRYDLEVADNHNYVANNILVHNCRTAYDGRFMSRGNKEFYTMDHCISELTDLFKQLEETGISVDKIDGEIYNNDYATNFEELVGLIKRKTLGDGTREKCEDVLQFHVFDIVTDDLTFRKRYKTLQKIFQNNDYKYLKLVEQTLVHTEAQADTLLTEYLNAGYEGVMLKNPNAEYVNKKDWNTLKYKLFHDAEYKVIELLEGKGNWSGCAKMATFETDDGKAFKATLTGSKELCKAIWDVREEYVGKLATVKYQELSKQGVPRFPTIKAFRDYE